MTDLDRSETSGKRVLPVIGERMPVHCSHSATDPVIRIEWGIDLAIVAPRPTPTRIHGSNGSPFSRVQVTYRSIEVIG